jgi:GMP synthase (glutamine-hydrolysing)
VTTPQQRPSYAPRVLVIQHEDDDPAHLFGQWMRAAGAEVVSIRAYLDEPVPESMTGIDALLVMGGAMGANDDAAHPWLTATKELIRQAVEHRIPTLGICLGHQLGAVALGGVVNKNPRGKQFGLIPVGWTDAARDDALLSAAPLHARALQWNDDVVVQAPPDAVVLAQTEHAEIQALRFAPAAWGLQWHPEVDADLIAPWIQSDPGVRDKESARHVVAQVHAARDELRATWQPVAERLVDLAKQRS